MQYVCSIKLYCAFQCVVECVGHIVRPDTLGRQETVRLDETLESLAIQIKVRQHTCPSMFASQV